MGVFSVQRHLLDPRHADQQLGEITDAGAIRRHGFALTMLPSAALLTAWSARLREPTTS